MREIIPTVFTKDKRTFMHRLRKVLTASRKIQVDFADGQFVSAKSVDLNVLPSFSKLRVLLEAHLMMRRPEKYLESLRRKGFRKVIFHLEVLDYDDIPGVIARIRALGMVPVVAINPETRITNKVLEIIDLTKYVLLMGVHPGKEKQKLRKTTFGRIMKIKSFSKRIIIQIDGGVNPENAKQLFKAGASILNSGSFISESQNPKEALKQLLH